MGKRYLDIKPGSLEDAISKVNEKLSPKQKKLDVNKNGKIDGSDLSTCCILLVFKVLIVYLLCDYLSTLR